MLLLAQTWVRPVPYLVVTFVGFSLFGIGLGFFATSAVDTVMTNAPMERQESRVACSRWPRP